MEYSLKFYKNVKIGDIIVDKYTFKWKILDGTIEKCQGYTNELYKHIKSGGGYTLIDTCFDRYTYKLPILLLQLVINPEITVTVTWSELMNSFNEDKCISDKIASINFEYIKFISVYTNHKYNHPLRVRPDFIMLEEYDNSMRGSYEEYVNNFYKEKEYNDKFK